MSQPPPILALYRGPNDGLVCALHLSAFTEPGVWGIAIADIVQHLVKAYAQRGMDAEAVRYEIVRVLDAELSRPTDEVYMTDGEWTPEGFIPYRAGKGEA